MIWLGLIGLVILLLLLALVIATFKPGGYPYVRRESLFSPAERSFLGVLDQAVGREYRVFGKVRVADVVQPRSGLDNSRRTSALNKVQAKHFDFVLCDKRDLSVACTIELDDKSHRRRKRKRRDEFLDELCQSVSLPLVRIKAAAAYSVPELRSRVLMAVGHRAEPTLMDTMAEPIADGARKTPYIPSKPGAPPCPKCAAPMVRRRATAGARAGQEYWSCSAFPQCRTIVPVG